MKGVFALLLILNGALLSYYTIKPNLRLQAASPIPPQISAEKIQIVALGDNVQNLTQITQAATNSCLQWGPINVTQLDKAQFAIDKLNLGNNLHIKQEEAASYWVYLPPLANLEQAQREVDRLQALGIKEHYVIQDNPKLRFAISLGIFKTEEAAQRQLALLQERGVSGAAIAKRDSQGKGATFVIREPGDVVANQLKQLQPKFAGSELKAVDCAEFTANP